MNAAATQNALHPAVRAALASLCGAAYVAGFAPLNWWPLTLLGVAGLFYLTERFPEYIRSLGFVFGFIVFLLGTGWVYVSIHVYGAAAPPLAATLVVLLALIMAGLVWVRFWAYHQLRAAAAAPWQRGLLFACIWVPGEWLLTWAFSGFPWLFAGYAFVDTPLAGFAPVGGVYLVSFAATLVAVQGVAIRQNPRLGATFAIAPWVLAAGLLQVSWTTPRPALDVALVQGNIDQAVKWQPGEQQAHLETHLALTENHWDADLVVWPEGAITYLLHQAAPVVSQLDEQGQQSGTAFVTGVPMLEGDRDAYVVYNGAIALGAGRGRYRKEHLVPFGEYVPFESLLRGAIAFFDLPMSAFSSGASHQPPLVLQDVNVGMAICYEIAFPALVRRRAESAQALMTLSNDTWFGASIGPHQHMQIARMRAIEVSRPVVRATNNGVTGLIDHRGVVTSRLPQFEAAVLRGQFVPQAGRTPYQLWGDAPVLGACAVVLVLAWRRRRGG